MVLDGFVELREIQRDEEVQQNIDFGHFLGQFIGMNKLHMFIDPLFALGSKIGIIFKLFDFGFVRLEFNNIQFVLKTEIIDQLIDEYFAQYSIEANKTNGLMVKFILDHEVRFITICRERFMFLFI